MARGQSSRGGGGRGGRGGRGGSRFSRRRKPSENPDVYRAEEVEAEEDLTQARFAGRPVERDILELPEDFEDEEIDEDTAFTEEDYLRYGDSTVSKRKPGKKNTRQQQKEQHTGDSLGGDDEGDQSPDDFEGESGDDGEFFMLTDLLQGKATVIEEGEKQGLVHTNDDAIPEDRGEADEGDEFADVEDRDVEDPLQHRALLRKLSKIDGYQKTGTVGLGSLGDELNEDEERTEPVEENEYNVGRVNTLSSSAGEEKISLAGLMSSLQETTGFGELKKQIEELDSKTRGSAKQKRGKGKGKGDTVSGPIAVPLADVVRERIDREVAYEKTSKDITRWQPQVSVNRRAEQLNFAQQQGPEQMLSNAELTVKFVETTPLECGIANILRECGFDDETAIKEFEKTQLEGLDERDQKARTAELARMRRLMFYREQKTKRWKKIKARKFHKQRQKDKEASKLSVDELETIDPEAAQERRQEEERRRAQERMSLKHKTRGSKWAQRQLKKGFASSIDGVRQALDEQNRLHLLIAAKARGDNDSDSSEAEMMDEEEREMERAREWIRTQEEVEDKDLPSLAKMGFMRKARARQQAELEEMLREKERMDELSSSDDDSDSESESKTKKTLKSKETTDEAEAGGRQSFTGKTRRSARLAKQQPSDESGDTGVPVKLLSDTQLVREVGLSSSHISGVRKPMSVAAVPAALFETPAFPTIEVDSSEDKTYDDLVNKTVNLKALHSAPSSSQNKQSQTQSEAVVSEDDDDEESTVLLGSERRQSKRIASSASAAEKRPKRTVDDAENPWLLSSSSRPSSSSTTSATKRARGEQPTLDLAKALKVSEAFDSDEDSDDEEVVNLLRAANGSTKVQKALIERAFGGDDLARKEFDEEKNVMIDEDDPDKKDLGMAGWGSWAGGPEVKPPKLTAAKRKRLAEIKAKKELEKRKRRKDGHLDEVIISQRTDKKALKYQVPSVPFPYHNADQYEQTHALPVGREWNAATVHAKMVRPRVVTKMGTIIQPLRYKPPPKDKKKSKKGGSSSGPRTRLR